MENEYIYYCKTCANSLDEHFYFLIKGYIPDPRIINRDECICCHTPFNQLKKTNIQGSDYSIIGKISTDPDFFEAMMQLKEEDIIEYQSRMAQFRAQVEGQKSAKAEEKSALKCPKCGSTNIATGARGVNHFWGFIGASKTVNRCGKCGYTWKPRG